MQVVWLSFELEASLPVLLAEGTNTAFQPSSLTGKERCPMIHGCVYTATYSPTLFLPPCSPPDL